jgi:ergothioneine biosynthesis protein EgtB
MSSLDFQIGDRETLRHWMQQCRQQTLALFATVDHDTFCQQAHPDFSPIGWHLGHIAYTEGLWLLEHLAHHAPLFPEYRRLFAADTLPKRDRVNLPTLTEVTAYLDTIRTQVLAYLDVAPLGAEQARLWLWLLQHECQHQETIAIVLALLEGRRQEAYTPAPQGETGIRQEADAVYIPAGKFEMGDDSLLALDNERSPHWVETSSYWIDRQPVTCQQYAEFMQTGGYENAQWWTAAGWAWLQQHPIRQPLYWTGDRDSQDPVCGVNWYEASAYARFVGKRLPTEAEWEKAVRHEQLAIGKVWEWTNTWFAGYPGFTAYPYRGYSQAYFDQQHRVLRGGSGATLPWAQRSTFRNWYHPHVREIFAGFRCARD